MPAKGIRPFRVIEIRGLPLFSGLVARASKAIYKTQYTQTKTPSFDALPEIPCIQYPPYVLCPMIILRITRCPPFITSLLYGMRLNAQSRARKILPFSLSRSNPEKTDLHSTRLFQSNPQYFIRSCCIQIVLPRNQMHNLM